MFALGVIYFEMLSVFETAHEKIEKIQNLKEGKISGIDEFEM